MISDEGPISAYNLERIAVIDQNIEATDGLKASLIANVTAARISARLSLLTNVALTKPEAANRWVIRSLVNNCKENLRLPMGYSTDNSPIKMPKKKELYKLGEFKGNLPGNLSSRGPLCLPKETRKIFAMIDEAPPLIKDCFDQGARLYQVALICGRFSPSVELAYRVAAIDAFSNSDPNPNDRHFSVFMRKYVKSLPFTIEPILEFLHRQVRSAHFHAGIFPLGEYTDTQQFDPFQEFEKLETKSYHILGLELTREAIFNWLLERISNKTTNEN